jgi:succinyl-CoA synthetase beta subunit
LKIHEYQAKELLRPLGVPIPRGDVAFTPDDAKRIATELACPVVVKAQVHVGGRGKAGGVKLAANPTEAFDKASQILGMSIKGLPVKKVLVTEAIDIKEEYYLGITVDRDARMLVLILSASGGVDIEEVAATHPERIAKVHIDPLVGLMDHQIRRAIYHSGVNLAKTKEIAKVTRQLYDGFIKYDAGLAEINPLVVACGGEVIAVDAKMDIDDNSLWRHEDLLKYREIGADLDEIEAFAQENHVAYVHMPPETRGPVGIIGNGAGLVMTTLDVVTRAGGKPNNFLDIGGGARADSVMEAIDIVLKDPTVKGLFINVFGGITRCDEVAKGLIEGAAKLPKDLPIVVRMTGTNEEAAHKMLEGTRLVGMKTMWEGAKKIVELVGKAQAVAG